ncbi:MAG: FAD-dependent oxidoreductase, partial [Eggerthellaceae bacterium]|nr:FAD-dependent oxidoreductase [Eggerthellaceae bacterium]
MQATKESTVAIIGYGTAGVNAAIALRTSGYDGPIRVFSDTGILPYSPILTSYYAGGKKTYDECFPWSAEELDELDLDVMANSPVVELDPEAHAIRTADGEFPYAKCVIATGSTPVPVGFPGVEGDEVYTPIMLRSMDDAQRLKDTIEDPTCRRFLVSGASMVALKTIEAALDHGLECSLVGMNPHVLDFNALPEAAERFERGLREKGVTLRLGTTIASVKRIDDPTAYHGRALEVTFANGETDTFDEISVSHGMKSNLDFVRKGSLEIDRALVVDEFMRTSDPDVYAAGDVAQATELISGEKRIVGIWKNAALQGACAGRAIAAELAGREPDPADAIAGSFATNTIA